MHSGGPSSQRTSSLWRLFPHTSRQIHDDGEEEEDQPSVVENQVQRQDSGLWKQGSLGLPAPEDSGFPATHPEMCIVRIRRCHLLEDALDEVSRQRPRDLFKPLRVHFIGEDGVDAGGGVLFEDDESMVLSPDNGSGKADDATSVVASVDLSKLFEVFEGFCLLVFQQ